jgi:hypothetical protein
VIFKVQGVTFRGIKAIDYGEKRERAKAWGMGRDYAPMGRTSGKYTPDPLKLTIFKSSLAEFLLMFTGPTGTLNQEREIVLQYVEVGTEAPMTVEFRRAVIASRHTALDESPEASVEEIELDVMSMSENGLTLHERVLPI